MKYYERCQEIEENLNKLKLLSTGNEEARELKVYADKLKDCNDSIALLHNYVKLFSSQDKKIKIDTDFTKFYKLLEKVQSKFNETPSRQSLVFRNQWTNLEEGINIIIDQFNSNMKNAWKEYCQNYYSGETPGQLAGTIAQTDANKNLLSNFQSDFSKFESLLKTLSVKEEDFSEIKILAEKLQETIQKLDRDVPEDVMHFLNDLNQNGGATLELLTEEVLAWLKQQESFHKFKVVRKI